MNGSPVIETGVLVIGGGIAGAGAAFEIASFVPVVLLEREDRCGYHATGRSAASFTENYGNTVVRRLALGSRSFLTDPPAGFCEHPILSPRGMITIAREDQGELMKRELERARSLVPSIEPITPAQAISRVSILRPEYVAGAFVEPHSMEVDVHGLHQGFLRGARARGARIMTAAAVLAIGCRQGRWQVETPGQRFAAPVVVNAAGAWADEIAVLAGLPPLGLVPKRRTAFNIPVPPEISMAGWPLVNDVGDAFYFKKDAGQLFASPSDATPSAPMDAYPDDLDIAVGVDRLERATTLKVGRVSHAWAGLRTFAADGSPVVGADEAAAGFVWLAGQGGYGVKTSPALSRICAAQVAGKPLPDDLLRLGVTAADLSPARLRGGLAPPSETRKQEQLQ